MPKLYTPKNVLLRWADDQIPRYGFVGNWHLQPARAIHKRLVELVKEQRRLPENTRRDDEIEQCRQALWAKEAQAA